MMTAWPAGWRIPVHRTDVGTMILAERIGAKSCIFVKDEEVSLRATSQCGENTAKIVYPGNSDVQMKYVGKDDLLR
jgi:hypothetical protein